MVKIAILGSGSFGTSLSIIFNEYGNQVVLWSHNTSHIDSMKLEKENKRFLPGIKISNNIKLTSDINLIKDSDIIILAVPSVAIIDIVKFIKPIVDKNSIIVNVSKGLSMEKGELLSDIIQEYLSNPVVILSGPSHAEELAKGIPTTMVACSKNLSDAIYIQDKLMNKTLRIYVNDDIIGTQVGSALKNIIALACGICDGMGLGDNSRAALMTRGLAEISRLGIAMGAKKETFSGLTGLGDLIVTCTSLHSRNRRAGILIGKGVSVEDAINQIDMVVEGYSCTKDAFFLAKKYNVTMPIVEILYYVLYGNGNLKEVVDKLMDRPKRHEYEQII